MRVHGKKTLTLIALLAQAACGGGGDDASEELDPPRQVRDHGPNAVSLWHQTAAAVVTSPALANGTAEERRPNYAVDMATVHVAIYDAVVALSGTHQALIARVNAETGLPLEPAVHAAAYTVLSGLYPNRSALYQATYEMALAALPTDAASMRALELGHEAARQVLAQRADDGRWTPRPAYVPGSAPGQFRGSNPINQTSPYIRPFGVQSTAQFRAAAPPSLDAPEYANAYAEVKAYGAAASSPRSEAQTLAARFHTMAPPLYWTRNYQQFASSQDNLVGNARAMAMLYVTQADALNSCFESKYHYNFWRPNHAIAMADDDGNAATASDPAWAPVLPTPNHPEYPSAHSCGTAATAEILRSLFGTRNLTFSFQSSETKTATTYSSVGQMVQDVGDARIHGGMHFRFAIEGGERLGREVAQWIEQRHFKPLAR
jgi:PAP2 superfamily